MTVRIEVARGSVARLFRKRDRRDKVWGRLSLLDRAKNRIGAVGVDTFMTIVMKAGGPSSSVYAGNITGVVGLEDSPGNTFPLSLKRTAKAETWVAILQAG